ncbi:MAG: PilZ domain-containing protein [Myxococcota bacterium]
MSAAQRQRVLVTLKNRSAFTEAYVAGGEHGAIWIGDAAAEVGCRVELELVFVAELMIFHVRGIVDFRDPERGLRVCIDAADANARDAIANFVSGQSDTDVNRRARRFPVEVPVEWADGGEMMPARTLDLSSNGAAIESEVLPAKGSVLALRFVEHNLLCRGDVVWLAREPSPRFGLMFMDGDEKRREELQTLIAQLLEERSRAR